MNSHDQTDKSHIEIFKSIYAKHFSNLCFVSFKLVNNKDIAEDIVQDAIVLLWDKRSILNEIKSIKAYLYRIVINKSMNYLNHEKIKKFYHDEIRKKAPISTDSNSYFNEKPDLINYELDNLPLKCKEIFLLHRYEGLKYKEIARDLSISVKNVEYYMSKTLKILRDKKTCFN